MPATAKFLTAIATFLSATGWPPSHDTSYHSSSSVRADGNQQLGRIVGLTSLKEGRRKWLTGSVKRVLHSSSQEADWLEAWAGQMQSLHRFHTDLLKAAASFGNTSSSGSPGWSFFNWLHVGGHVAVILPSSIAHGPDWHSLLRSERTGAGQMS
eukprot:341067-Amphidinium_carterae.1